MEKTADSDRRALPGAAFSPAQPLWQLAPTRAGDGRPLADFMMLIPGLGGRSAGYRAHVEAQVRETCAGFGCQVAFADLNYAINVLWVSVAAEPGLAGRVAQAIRGRVPEALLVGGQLGTVPALPRAARWRAGWRSRLQRIGVGLRRLPGASR